MTYGISAIERGEGAVQTDEVILCGSKVYRLGHEIFILKSRVQLPVRLFED